MFEKWKRPGKKDRRRRKNGYFAVFYFSGGRKRNEPGNIGKVEEQLWRVSKEGNGGVPSTTGGEANHRK